MRLVVARMKPSQVEVVRQALAAVHVTRLTVLDTQGCLSVGPATRLVQEVLPSQRAWIQLERPP